jgi:hypothetical protein
VPPLNDIPPIPIGLWPFSPFFLAREELRPINWQGVITGFPTSSQFPLLQSR